MTLRGDLDSISLADVFQTLSMTQQAGTLFVQDGESRKAIYFSKNGVSLVTSGEKKGGKLGDMLVGLGKITPDHLEEALSIHREAGIRLGEAMIRLGFVTEKDIEAAVRVQIEEEIYDLFSWENASFEFVEGDPPEGTFDGDEAPPVTQLTFNVNSLIMEAARRIDEWDLIEKVIPSVREIFVLDQKKLKEMEYTDRERMILGFVDGHHMVKEVVEKSHVPKFDVCKFLYRLIEEGKVQRAPFEALLDAGDDAVRAEDLHAALKFYEQALEGKIKKKSDQVKVHLRLAQTLEFLEQKKEAADQYKIIANAKIEEKDIEGAINIWQKVIDLNPLDLENKERLINVYLENRDQLDPGRSDVIRSIEYSLFKNGKSLAMAFAYAGQIDRAKEVLARLIELVPSNMDLRKALANIYLDAGEKAEAVEELEQIAQFLLANREYDELNEVYKNILKIDPSRHDIRKKISMIESGEAVSHRGGGGRSIGKILLIVVILLVVVGGGGAAGYYLVTARQEWSRIEQEALGIWGQSKEKSLPEAEREKLRNKAREMVNGVPKKYPGAMLESKIKALLDGWESEVEQEREDKRQQEETEAMRVAAKHVELEKVLNGSGPLDVDKVVTEIDRIVKEAFGNERAESEVDKLKVLKGKFERMRATAENLLLEARRAEAAAKETGDYKKHFTKAWEKYTALFEKGDRFPDLLNQVRLPVRIESMPPKAQAFINDDVPASTPLTFRKIPNTPIRIRVARVGYREQERSFKAEKIPESPIRDFGKRCYLRFDLEIEPLAEARLPKETLFADPVARGGHLFIANDLGDISSLSWHGTHLRKEWTLRPSSHGLNKGFKSRLFTSSKYVFFPCEDGKVYRVDLEPKGPAAGTLFKYDPSRDGEEHIIRELGGAALSEDEKILVVGTDRGVTAFDVESGKILWQHLLSDEKERAWAVPLVLGNRAFAGTDQGALLAFDLNAGPKDGRPLWRLPSLGSPIRSALAEYNGVLYAGTEDGNLRYVKLENAQKEARVQFIQENRAIACKPLFAEDFVFITSGSFLYKLRAENLVEVWRFDAGGRSGKVSAPTLFENSIFLGNGDGTLFSIDWRDTVARVRWFWKIQGSVNVRPAVDQDGTVCFVAQDGDTVNITLFRE